MDKKYQVRSQITLMTKDVRRSFVRFVPKKQVLPNQRVASQLLLRFCTLSQPWHSLSTCARKRT